MGKILGIDTGTNSLGWAIVERNEEGNSYKLLDYGVNIFQEGVKIEKGIESSKAADRTKYRGVRRHYWRRKIRKIRLLTVLSNNSLCPPLSSSELRNWREGKSYPMNEMFLDWQKTDDSLNVNPYYYRHLCLTQKLDLSNLSQRYILGRAIYHINQRRGFLSNRKESTKEIDGKVKDGIKEISDEILAENCEYLGEYFYKLYQRGERIRSHYTSRNEHYLAEFRAICKKQDLPEKLSSELEKVIFYQRPLKSQKQQVGKCKFEPKKARCSTSHPYFEEFRMYQFINNIKVQTPDDNALRFLNNEERELILPLFFRKSKSSFHFEDIAKKISGGKKNTYSYYKDSVQTAYKFNYFMDTNVSGCPVTAQLMEIFGYDWVNSVNEVYTLAEGKTSQQVVNDVWHALFFYDDAERLKEFGKNRLQLSDNEAEKFSKISLPQDYAALSLKAIMNILPYMKEYGLIYSEAVFLGKLGDIMPKHLWSNDEIRNNIINAILEEIRTYSKEDGRTVDAKLKAYLKDRYMLEDSLLAKLYHPSMIETYQTQHATKDGVYQLGSPRISSVKNPMAMHSLFRLRKVVNELLKEGKIDKDTTVNIEFARELNDANRRKAIKSFQSDNEKIRKECKLRIEEHYKSIGSKMEPSEDDILKYQLWEEQNHVCLYTGETIGLSDFLGPDPAYDKEHTIPQSVGGDSTKMNLTLCQNRFNRDVKKAQIPTQLANHEEILQRISSWKEKYEDLDKQIRKLKGVSPADKEAKDRIIIKRHKLSLERDYWRGKYERFTMAEVPEGFARRQGNDIGLISKYARLYLKSVFDKVFVVKGLVTSDFRKHWGIQGEYEKKERVNHVHHCVDAITIACIGPYQYSLLAGYYHEQEDYQNQRGKKPQFPKPWPTFVEDVKSIQDKLIVAHYTQDNMGKIGRRRVQTSGGKVLTQGDVARGALHLDTSYGAISTDEGIRYVIRKPLSALDSKDIDKIVDDEVRNKVLEAVAKHGTIAKAIEANDVWMNREKGIKIAKVRTYADGVKNPIHIRYQRDLSEHEYKHQYHVMNDRNYLMAIYEDTDSNGKPKREIELFSMLDAAKFYKESNKGRGSIVPEVSKSGYKLLYYLKIGTMVLLYEESPEEVFKCSREELSKRLYIVTGMRNNGRMELLYQQEARQGKEIGKPKDGAYTQNEELRPWIRMYSTQFKGLVQGKDFTINELGDIKFI